MKLIILGPPGSGKGTIAEKLEKELGIHQISAGELLREEVRNDTPIGKGIKEIIERGDLVADDLIVKMMKQEMGRHKHYVLDGFPRTIYQAEQMESATRDTGVVLYIDVPEEVVIQRLAGRRICSKDPGHGYHLVFLPPRRKGRCDIDNAPLLQRKDDRPGVIKTRFRVYHQRTEPVVQYYRNKGLVRVIDGKPLPDAVYASVKRLLQHR